MKTTRRVLAIGAALLTVAGTLSTAAAGTAAAAPEPASSGLQLVDPEFGDLRIDVRPEGSDFVEFGPTSADHVTITNADEWHDAGITGAGVKVGVVDFFNVAYWDTAEHGPLPVAGVNARCIALGGDCTDYMFEPDASGGGDRHGVAVVELIKDMAPDAQIYIGTALTPDDYGALIDWFAGNGVTVLNRSLGSRYDGPGDGRGAMNDVAAYANSRGITWINSGGNNGSDRYYRQPVRLAGGSVAFGPSGSSIYLPYRGCASPGGIRWANDWDQPAPDRTDYDAIIWDAPNGMPQNGIAVGIANADQHGGARPIENFVQSFCPLDDDRTLYLEIRWGGGDITGDVLEVLDYGDGFASNSQTAFSASTSVVDSTLAGVLAVGAVEPANSTSIAPYSSQGPTNDGRVAPDVAAPSGLASVALGGQFSGTSASSPVVTGGAALLLSAGLAAGPTALGDLIRHTTRDLGPPGPDNAYGHGEFLLPGAPTPTPTTPSQFVSLAAPQRVLDTRPETALGPASLIGQLTPGEILDLPVAGVAGIPGSGVTAVAVNLTAVTVDRSAFVQALPTISARLGGYSNINIDSAGQTRANFAIVPVGTDGSISLYSSGSGHMIVDVLGFFRSSGGAVTSGRFVELPVPDRVLDTRTTGGPIGGMQQRAVPWPASVDPSLASALVVTITGTEAGQAGWLQAFPSNRPDVIATSSTVNLGQGQSVANTAIVPIGGGGMSVTGYFGDGAAHAIVDVIGYITSSAAPSSTSGQFVPVRPARALDSRISGGELAAGQPRVVDAGVAAASIPTTASGVVWNIAAVATRQPGYGQAWRSGGPQPATSAFNWSNAGETRAAAVISAVDSRAALVAMNDGTSNPATIVGHVIVDVFGYFT